MPRKPLEPLNPSDEELDELAEITPEDIEAAKAQFHEDAPPGWGGLLDAEPVEDEL